MVLEECKDCSGQISTSAVFCPHCGRDIKSKRVLNGWQILVVALIIIFNIGFALSGPQGVAPAIALNAILGMFLYISFH